MKLCVLGNSHVGMLRQSFGERPISGVDVTWVARGKDGLDGARIEQTRFVANDPDLVTQLTKLGMPTEVDLAAFDGLVFVSGTYSLWASTLLLVNHRILSWPSGQDLMWQVSKPHSNALKHPLISEDAFMEAVAECVRQSITYRLIEAVRTGLDLPITVVSQPYPSQTALEGARGAHPILKRMAKAGDGAALTACYRQAHELAFQPFDQIRLVFQEDETVCHGFLSKADYMRGAVRLNLKRKQPDDDILHGNIEMGTLLWRQILEGFAEV